MTTARSFQLAGSGIIVILTTFLVVALMFTAPADGQEAIEPTTPPILSGCEIDYPPFCFVGSDGQAQGFSIELMRAALQAMGRQVTFRVGPWKDVRGWLEGGEIQALPLVGRTPERESLFDFTFPYMSLHGAIVVRQGVNDIKNLDDLKGKQVAVMKGDNAEEFLRRERRGIEIHTTETFKEALESLSKGLYDAVVIQRLVGLRIIQENKIKNLWMISKPIEGFRQDFCFAVKEGDRETLALLNEGLALIMANGAYRHYHAKWFASLELPNLHQIVVGGDHNYPPFEFLDEKGRPAGFNVDISHALAQALGLDIKIHLGPWAEIRQELVRGDINAVQGMLYSPERDLNYDFTQSYTVIDYVGVTRKGSDPPPTCLAELKGKRIVVQKGDIVHDLVVEHGLESQITAVDAQEDALRELSLGRYDCALVARMTAMYWIKKNGWNNLVLSGTPILSPEYCFAVSQNQKALVALLGEGLKVLGETGEYRRIYEKWMGVYEKSPPNLATVFRYVAMVALPLFALLLISFLWSWSLRKQVARRTEELRKSEVQFRSLVDGAPDAIFVQTNQHFSYLNASACRLFGAPSSDHLLGQSVMDRVHPSGREAAKNRMDDLDRGSQRIPIQQAVYQRLDGGEVLVEVSAVPILFEGKNGALVFVRDITYRERAERALRESEARYRAIVDNLPMTVCRWLPDTTLTYANKLYLDVIAGDTDVTGKRWIEFLPEDFRHEKEAFYRELAIAPKSVTSEHRYAGRDGTLRLYYWIDVPIFNADKKLIEFQSVGMDITDLKRAEAERERLLSAIEQAGEAIIITDPTGVVEYINPAFERVTGYLREEVMGQTPRVLKSGEQSESFYQELWGTISAGKTWAGRMVNKRKDGSFFTENVTISPVFDRFSGQIVNYVAVERDVTDEIRLEAQFQQAQKMESIGRLAGGVAHDHNNMLTVIIGYAQLALDKLEPGQKHYRDFEKILSAAKRSRDLTRQLLAFARKQTISPRMLDLNATVEGMLQMLRRLIGEDIDLLWKPSHVQLFVEMDPAQIDQILVNLSINARDAISGVGKITIETNETRFNEAYCADHPGFVPGEFALIAVSDNGCGIDKETLAHIFEPFFTTKTAGMGTGLGLATIYGIVKQNNGFINVYSEPGTGTTVRIYLPYLKNQDIEVSKTDDELPVSGQGETVLLVEDEPWILDITSTILNKLGYHVLTADSPSQAMMQAREHGDVIHLLITDVIMPEMNGRELSRQLHELYPDLKTLFMSGYTANVIAHHGVLDEGMNFIQKPFALKDLAIKVRETIGQG